jgi:long-subunit acyl-CoA synthetase (AMP-forming)
MTIWEVIEVGKQDGDIGFEDPTPDSVYMFCYTSGTTGDPKGAMLT